MDFHTFSRFYEDPQNPRKPKCFQGFRGPSSTPNRPPNGSQDGPRGPQDGPRGAQDAPRAPPRHLPSVKGGSGLGFLPPRASPAEDKRRYNYLLGVVKSSKEVNIDLIRRWAEGPANVSFSTQASYPNGMLFKRCVDDNVSGSEIEPHITLLG